MLCLVPLAQRMPRAGSLHPALKTGAPRAKQQHRHGDSRWWPRVVRRDAAPRPAIWAVSNTPAPPRENSTPLPLYRSRQSSPAHSLASSGAHVRALPARLCSRIKVSFCFWTELCLLPLAPRTPGRRTLVGDQLWRVGNKTAIKKKDLA